MKKKTLLLVICLLVIAGLYAQTPTEIKVKAYLEFQNADKEMNAVCQKIVKAHLADSSFVRNFRAAQKIWIQLRDAELRIRYPEKEKGYSDNVQPKCWSVLLTKLTKDRTNKLNALLEGSEESCSD